LTLLCVVGAARSTVAQGAQPAPSIRQSVDDAWWTGPLLANSPAALPRGHLLLEPYLYDVIGSHSNGLGSRTYVLFGLSDRLSGGLIPYLAYNAVGNGPSSSGLGMGDQTLLLQYCLVAPPKERSLPTVAFNVQEVLPTGKYDRLGDRPSDGLGGGVFTTTLGLYSQTYFWMPNGRILRTRLNVSASFSTTANLRGVSVYGTDGGFRGQATPGDSLFVDASAEYSLTKKWVLATDLFYGRNASTLVAGSSLPEVGTPLQPTPVRFVSPASSALGFAPAVEYSWKPTLGVILGVRVIPAGHHTPQTMTPAVAINFVH
jgi:hypothetical protein